tara:strand:- start:12551 stop:12796 length:246 start_codon:yes stop_codon:yes gene_type:complete
MRLKNIVLTDLINERLVAYEELERVMNKKDRIENTVKESKNYLKQIVILNAMIEEWQQINNPENQIDFDKLADELKQTKDE